LSSTIAVLQAVMATGTKYSYCIELTTLLIHQVFSIRTISNFLSSC